MNIDTFEDQIINDFSEIIKLFEDPETEKLNECLTKSLDFCKLLNNGCLLIHCTFKSRMKLLIQKDIWKPIKLSVSHESLADSFYKHFDYELPSVVERLFSIYELNQKSHSSIDINGGE